MDPYIRRCWLERVVDGDTLIVTIDLGWDMQLRSERIRLLDVHAPEITGPKKVEGQRYKKIVEEWLFGKTLYLRSAEYKRDSFGRTVAEVLSSDGQSLNSYLNVLLRKTP